MPVLFLSSDIFATNPSIPLVHAVSFDFSMSRGLALEVKSRYGGVETLLPNPEPEIGSIALMNGRGRFIICLITKHLYFHAPRFRTVFNSLRDLKTFCIASNHLTITMPFRLSCGLDGLPWTSVNRAICRLFEDSPITVLICQHQPTEVNLHIPSPPRPLAPRPPPSTASAAHAQGQPQQQRSPGLRGADNSTPNILGTPHALAVITSTAPQSAPNVPTQTVSPRKPAIEQSRTSNLDSPTPLSQDGTPTDLPSPRLRALLDLPLPSARLTSPPPLYRDSRRRLAGRAVARRSLAVSALVDLSSPQPSNI